MYKISHPALCYSFITFIRWYSKIMHYLKYFLNMLIKSASSNTPCSFTKKHPHLMLDLSIMCIWVAFLIPPNDFIFHTQREVLRHHVVQTWQFYFFQHSPYWEKSCRGDSTKFHYSIFKVSTHIGGKCTKLQGRMFWNILHFIELVWSLFHAFFQSLTLLVFTNI